MSTQSFEVRLIVTLQGPALTADQIAQMFQMNNREIEGCPGASCIVTVLESKKLPRMEDGR